MKNWSWIYGLEASSVQAFAVPGSIASVCGFEYFCHGSVIIIIMAAGYQIHWEQGDQLEQIDVTTV